MSSPFQKSFSSKSPFRKEGVVTLSEQDIKNAKSASSQSAKEISYEGQGGKDYENRPEQFLGDSIANESSANKAARLQGRVDKREKRTTKKGILRGDERATFDADGKRISGKTFDIQQRADSAKQDAISQAKAKAEANDNFNKWLNDPKNSKASDAMIEEQKKLAGL